MTENTRISLNLSLDKKAKYYYLETFITICWAQVFLWVLLYKFSIRQNFYEQLNKKYTLTKSLIKLFASPFILIVIKKRGK